MLLLMAAASFFFVATSRAAPRFESAFLWEQANAAAAVARTEADYLRAAELYASLVRDQGVHNGIVFFNMGAVLLKGGLYDRALLTTLRAERYDGTTPEIQRNLLLATARGDGKAELTLPWYRIPLIWHFGLPYRMRLSIAVVAGAFTIVLAGLCRLRVRQGVGPFLVLGAAIAVVFTTSVMTTVYQEHRDDRSVFADHPAVENSTTQ